MEIYTDTLVNTQSPFPPTITWYTVFNKYGVLVLRTTDEDECTNYLALQTKAELRDK